MSEEKISPGRKPESPHLHEALAHAIKFASENGIDEAVAREMLSTMRAVEIPGKGYIEVGIKGRRVEYVNAGSKEPIVVDGLQLSAAATKRFQERYRYFIENEIHNCLHFVHGGGRIEREDEAGLAADGKNDYLLDGLL